MFFILIKKVLKRKLSLLSLTEDEEEYGGALAFPGLSPTSGSGNEEMQVQSRQISGNAQSKQIPHGSFNIQLLKM